MKRIVVLIGVLALSTALFVGCTPKTTEPTDTDTTVTAPEGTEDTDATIEIESGRYTVVDKEYEEEERDIFILYPQIEGLADEEKMASINSTIEEFVLSWTDEPYLNTFVMYEAKRQDEDYFSFSLTGATEIQDMGDGVVIQHSMNIDMKSGEVISYDNFVADKAALVELVNQKAAEVGQPLFEGEGMRFYIVDGGVTFFYMPMDDSAKSFVEIFLSNDELEGIVNW